MGDLDCRVQGSGLLSLRNAWIFEAETRRLSEREAAYESEMPVASAIWG